MGPMGSRRPSGKDRFKRRLDLKKGLAVEHITSYFAEAARMFPKEQRLAHRYVALARQMSMRFKVPIPRIFRFRFCKNCLHYLVAGVNSRIRLDKGMRVILCKDCKHISRYRYKA